MSDATDRVAMPSPTQGHGYEQTTGDLTNEQPPRLRQQSGGMTDFQGVDMQDRTCAQCSAPFTASRVAQLYCTLRCRKEAEATRHGRRNRACKRCEICLGELSLKTYCAPCRDTLKRERKKAERKTRDRSQQNHRKRARLYGVDYEPVKSATVFDRDGWRCGICRKPVRKVHKYPHLMSATLDHIVPMSQGGGHTYVNTQLAHFMCNSIKSAGGGGEQLALIG